MADTLCTFQLRLFISQNPTVNFDPRVNLGHAVHLAAPSVHLTESHTETAKCVCEPGSGRAVRAVSPASKLLDAHYLCGYVNLGRYYPKRR